MMHFISPRKRAEAVFHRQPMVCQRFFIHELLIISRRNNLSGWLLTHFKIAASITCLTNGITGSYPRNWLTSKSYEPSDHPAYFGHPLLAAAAMYFKSPTCIYPLSTHQMYHTGSMGSWAWPAWLFDLCHLEENDLYKNCYPRLDEQLLSFEVSSNVPGFDLRSNRRWKTLKWPEVKPWHVRENFIRQKLSTLARVKTFTRVIFL